MDNEKFIEFITDSPNNRGYFIPLEKLKPFINANLGTIMFHSYYLYDQEVLDFYGQHSTLKGFSGRRYPYQTILDIDAEDNIKGAANTALEIYEYMIEYHELAENNIRVWFSGGKGFHIQMPNIFGFEGGEALHKTNKATLNEVFGRWEQHLDLMPTMSTGIIRCPWSGHKSEMMKVPLEHRHLQAIAQDVLPPSSFASQENYKEQFDVIAEPMDDHDNGRLRRLIQTDLKVTNHHQLNDMDKPNSVVTCMQKLLLRGPVKGRRHKDSLRLVSNWRRQGIPASFSAMMLIDWLGIDTKGEEAQEFRKIVRDVYEQSYAYSCKDEVMAEYCDSKCIFYKRKDYILEVSDNNSMMSSYKSYLKNVQSNNMDIKQAFGFTGNYKILPGEVGIVTGETGMGKSAFVQTILAKAETKALYFNLEMHEALIYRRFLQIEYQMSKDEINGHIKNGTDFSNALPWLHILSTSPDISDLDRLISQKDYQYVVVDTSDGIQANSAGNNEYRKLGMIINELREIAQNRNITIILIHHIKKTNEFRNKIQLNDLAGNRANVTKMDHVFAIEPAQRDNVRILRSLKTRDGEKMELPFIFDFKTMTFKRASNYDNRQSTSGNLRIGSS